MKPLLRPLPIVLVVLVGGASASSDLVAAKLYYDKPCLVEAQAYVDAVGPDEVASKRAALAGCLGRNTPGQSAPPFHFSPIDVPGYPTQLTPTIKDR